MAPGKQSKMGDVWRIHNGRGGFRLCIVIDVSPDGKRTKIEIRKVHEVERKKRRNFDERIDDKKSAIETENPLQKPYQKKKRNKRRNRY